MKITIFGNGKLVNLDLDSQTRISVVKSAIESEILIPVQNQMLLYKNVPLSDNSTISSTGYQENDIINVVEDKQNRQNSGRIPADIMMNASKLQQYCHQHPELIQQFMRSNPLLGEAILNTNDPSVLQAILDQIKFQNQNRNRQKQELINKLNSNPMNKEYQKQIEEMINREQIEENRKLAIQYMPESFISVMMLYVDCTVNNTKCVAFVDSGAQKTILSDRFAEKCGLMRLLDKRYAGIAQGVGTAQILGRVHRAPIKLGNHTFECSFTVIKDQSVDLLFGLDMLKKHQVNINLQENCLYFPHAKVKVPFLGEKDLKTKMKEYGVQTGNSFMHGDGNSSQSNTNSTNSQLNTTSSSSSSRNINTRSNNTNSQANTLPTTTTTTTTTTSTSSNTNINNLEEKIQTVVSVTNATRERARILLLNNGGDTTRVINMIFNADV